MKNEQCKKTTSLEIKKCPSLAALKKTIPGMNKARYASYKRGWETADKRLKIKNKGRAKSDN